MRPTFDRDRATARVPHPAVAISLLSVAVAVALSACGDSTSPAATASAPEAREARAFSIAGVTYPTVAIQSGTSVLAVGAKQTVTAKLATPTATWMGAYVTWTTSNSAVASVSTSDWGYTNGDVATITGVASGTATITGTTQSGTSGSITITVGSATQAVSQGGYHEPSGMATQINTGPISTEPAQYINGVYNWTMGTIPAQWSNYSPATMSGTGEWAGNISSVPGGTGLRFTYGPSLAGGNSPVRIGTSIPNHGSGDLYVRWNFRLSPNWTLSEASGLKLMEPRTVNSTENHVIAVNSDGQSTNGSNMWLGVLLQFATGSGTQGINVPGNSEGQAPVPSQAFSSAVANVGGAARGTWHMMEAYFQHESSAGANNGQLTLWVDGTQVFQSSSLHFFESGESMGWNFLMFDPTYGGDKATDHPPESIYWDIDQLYLSTK